MWVARVSFDTLAKLSIKLIPNEANSINKLGLYFEFDSWCLISPKIVYLDPTACSPELFTPTQSVSKYICDILQLCVIALQVLLADTCRTTAASWLVVHPNKRVSLWPQLENCCVITFSTLFNLSNWKSCCAPFFADFMHPVYHQTKLAYNKKYGVPYFLLNAKK